MPSLTSAKITKFYRNCYLSLPWNQECLQERLCWQTWQPLIVYGFVLSSTQPWVMLWKCFQTWKHITWKPTPNSQLNSVLLPSMINDQYMILAHYYHKLKNAKFVWEGKGLQLLSFSSLPATSLTKWNITTARDYKMENIWD